jgi:integration host factor subunit beta
MNRTELITSISSKFPQLTAKNVELSVNVIFDAIVNTLAQNGRIEMRGFGSFCLKFRPPRNGRNPKSGEYVLVPAKYVPFFRAGKELRERVSVMGKKDGL